MSDDTWDTDETWRIIMNDAYMYDRAETLGRSAWSISILAEEMEDEFAHAIATYPHSDVCVDAIDWEQIAEDMIGDDES